MNMNFFNYKHLPEGKNKDVSMQFNRIANYINDNLPSGSEKSTALRKILEAKDSAVRSALEEQGVL